jgi:ATP-dependent Clp endopeptidase proteolytic subunit ClpP
MHMSLDDARKNWRAHFENRTVPKAKAAAPIFRAKSGDPDTTEILLYDEIGYWGVTAKDFQAQLAGVSTPNICLHINSPGGDVFDGLAIYSALKAHPARVTTIVDGLAASAASFIALAGDKVCMAENAFMMIHNAWGVAMGNKAEMLDMASTLGKLDGQLASIYAAKTGKTQEDCAALMDGDVDGTWFTAQEAKDAGLIDMIDPEPDEEPDENQPWNATVQRMRMRCRVAEIG